MLPIYLSFIVKAFMITDKNLVKICIIVSFIGILLLVLYSWNFSVQKYDILDIDEDLIGNKIKTQAVVENVSKSGGNYFIDFKDSNLKGFIPSVDSGKINDISNLSTSNVIDIEGKITLYKGGLEIIIQNLEIIS